MSQADLQSLRFGFLTSRGIEPTTWFQAGYTAFGLGLPESDAELVPEDERAVWFLGRAAAGGAKAFADGVNANPHTDPDLAQSWQAGWQESLEAMQQVAAGCYLSGNPRETEHTGWKAEAWFAAYDAAGDRDEADGYEQGQLARLNADGPEDDRLPVDAFHQSDDRTVLEIPTRRARFMSGFEAGLGA